MAERNTKGNNNVIARSEETKQSLRMRFLASLGMTILEGIFSDETR